MFGVWEMPEDHVSMTSSHVVSAGVVQADVVLNGPVCMLTEHLLPMLEGQMSMSLFRSDFCWCVAPTCGLQASVRNISEVSEARSHRASAMSSPACMGYGLHQR